MISNRYRMGFAISSLGFAFTRASTEGPDDTDEDDEGGDEAPSGDDDDDGSDD